MLDDDIPTGALDPDTERIVTDELTSIVLRVEGADLYVLDQKTLLPEESLPESSPR